jgi:CRISPR-associated endonuclease Cas3-HD
MSDSYNQVLAHPSETVEEHINEVMEKSGCEISDSLIDKELLDIIIRTHDFGKHTSWYQEYIRDVENYSKSDKMKRHSFLGAITAMFVAREVGYNEHKQVLAFYAVAKHHGHPGNLNNHSTYTDLDNNKNKYERVKKQLADILSGGERKGSARKIIRTAGVRTDNPLEELSKFVLDREYIEVLKSCEPNEDTYIGLLKYWSSLIFCDRTATAGISFHSSVNGSIKSKKIDSYIKSLDKPKPETEKELNQLRERARTNCVENADRLDCNQVGLITLPTGFGKTLTGLQTAMRRAEQKGGRVVYALPFTTIIEQTDDVIRSAFESDKLDPEYTVHHYLSDTRSVTDESDDFRNQELHAKTWRSDIVLTTFVQLFESIAGSSSVAGAKIPSLENSVVLIDEPQGISYSWWLLVGKLIDIFSEHYNTDFIIMTATQPKIASRNEFVQNVTELLDYKEQYFSFLRDNPRVEYNIHDSVIQRSNNVKGDSMSLTEVSDLTREEASSLIICNSISQVNELSKHINSSNKKSINSILGDFYGSSKIGFNREINLDELNQVMEEGQKMRKQIIKKATEYVIRAIRDYDNIVASLTTRLRPVDRKIILNIVKNILDDNDKNVKLVSTQLVEAGVDISFDEVYRDLAPISSVVQAAGRCNRSYEGEKGSVNLVYMNSTTEGADPPAEKIYQKGYRLLSPTFDTIKYFDSSSVSEYEMVLEGVEEYYKSLHRDVSPGDYSLVKMLKNADFKSLRSESLIPEVRKTADVLIINSTYSKRLVERYRGCLNSGDFNEAKVLSKLLQSYSISVPVDSLDLSNTSLYPVSQDTSDYLVLDAQQHSSQYQIKNSVGISASTSVDGQFI